MCTCHISVRMTIHFFWMGFLNLHVCTNDYHFFLNGLSSFTFLYKWLPFLFELVFVMHILCKWLSIFFLNGSSSCTFLYEWIPSLLNGLLSCTFLNEWLPFLFEWIVVMHVSVQMTTIYFWKDFRHLHFCTNDYHFVVYGFLSCTFCEITFHILCIWIFVMHIFVRMTFHILLVFPCVQCSSMRE